mmetsp:Transcript_2110/g.5227  ORF Transcript_2110/g.5227 Transcript_2110/m.5227 type:complete len:201 (-) Transcript_2110:160-762(-)
MVVRACCILREWLLLLLLLLVLVFGLVLVLLMLLLKSLALALLLAIRTVLPLRLDWDVLMLLPPPTLPVLDRAIDAVDAAAAEPLPPAILTVADGRCRILDEALRLSSMPLLPPPLDSGTLSIAGGILLDGFFMLLFSGVLTFTDVVALLPFLLLPVSLLPTTTTTLSESSVPLLLLPPLLPPPLFLFDFPNSLLTDFIL